MKTNEEKVRLILALPPPKVAAAAKVSLDYRWKRGNAHQSYRGLTPTYQDRIDAALGVVRDILVLLMPEHETVARQVFDHIPWPEGFPSTTFESLFGLTCATCNGTGVAGFLSGVRCPKC